MRNLDLLKYIVDHLPAELENQSKAFYATEVKDENQNKWRFVEVSDLEQLAIDAIIKLEQEYYK